MKFFLYFLIFAVFLNTVKSGVIDFSINIKGDTVIEEINNYAGSDDRKQNKVTTEPIMTTSLQNIVATTTASIIQTTIEPTQLVTQPIQTTTTTITTITTSDPNFSLGPAG